MPFVAFRSGFVWLISVSDHCLKCHRLNLLTAEGLVAAPGQSNTEELPQGVIKTQEENTKLPQHKHKPHSYRAEGSDNKNTAVTKAAFSPQINALYSF